MRRSRRGQMSAVLLFVCVSPLAGGGDARCRRRGRRPPPPPLAVDAGGAAHSPTGRGSARVCELHDLLPPHSEPLEYEPVLRLQRALRDELVRSATAAPACASPCADKLLLLQHTPTFTLGTASTEKHLRFRADEPPNNTPLVRTERGGEVTYHAPGQVVGYPILDLRRHRQDLHWYVWALEEVVLRALVGVGVDGAARRAGLRGVWLDGAKVCAVGVKISRWVTAHGVALNVRMSERHWAGFGHIVPCGIADSATTQLADIKPDITIRAVGDALRSAFSEVFQVNLVDPPPGRSIAERSPLCTATHKTVDSSAARGFGVLAEEDAAPRARRSSAP